MSTRATVIIRDQYTTLYFYRHSDGYLDCTGKDLKDFVEGYRSEAMRADAMQSAGWLILRGHSEYNEDRPCAPNPNDRGMGWKCGAYEPSDSIASDVEYVYVIDLEDYTLSACEPTWGSEDPTLSRTKLIKEFTVCFQPGIKRKES